MSTHMTASQHLRNIQAQTLDPDTGYDAMLILVDALPALITAIEAAEKYADKQLGLHAMHIRVKLDALREQLEDNA